jgi:WD40 repeat protein
MAWPQSTDFLAAVQDLAASMDDKELQGGEVVCTPLGLPMLWAGNFADVFKIHCPSTGNTWALKCFTRPVQGLHDRYRHIAAHLERANLPFTVDFQYLECGIRIAGEWFPVLKMRWVEGLTLSQFVEERLEQPGNLKMLLDLWERLATRLREAQVTHADLQHGNVLLVPTSGGAFVLRLVDYDGMFVPDLVGASSGEVGHPAYQHPQRLREGIFNAEVDRFSHLAIYTAIRCLMSGRTRLWERFNNGDNLLFREEDFRNPGESKLFRLLWQNLTDIDARTLVRRLILACKSPLEETPLLDEVLSDGKPLPLNSEQESAIRAILTPLPKLSAKSDVIEDIALEQVAPSASDIPFEQPPVLSTSPAPRKATPGRIFGAVLASLRGLDRLLAAIAGPEKPLLRNFLRILPVIVVIGVLAGGMLYSHRRAVRQRELAAAQKMEEEAAARKAEEEELRTKAEAVKEAEEARQRQIEEARRKEKEAEESRKKVEEERLVAEKAAAEKRNSTFGQRLQTFKGHQNKVISAAFSPDGKRVLTGDWNNTAILWDAKTGEQLHLFKGQNTGHCSVAFNPNGKVILTGFSDLSGSRDDTAVLWNAATFEQIRVFKGRAIGYVVAFSPDGRHVLTGPNVTLWDTNTGNPLRELKGHAGGVMAIAFSPDGQRALTGSLDRTAILWDVNTGKRIRDFMGHGSEVMSVAFSPNGNRALLGCHDNAVILYDVDTGKQIRVSQGRGGGLTPVAFSPDGKWALAGVWDQNPVAILYDADSGEPIHAFEGHSDMVAAVAFSPDGRQAITGSWDGTAVLWNADMSKSIIGTNTTPPMESAANKEAAIFTANLHFNLYHFGTGSWHTQFVHLSESPINKQWIEPKSMGVQRVYGVLPLGENTKINIILDVLDEKRASARFAMNDDVRFDNKPAFQLPYTLQFPIAYPNGSQQQYAIQFEFGYHGYRNDHQSIHVLRYHQWCLREGTVAIEGKEYPIAILDDETTGDYSNLKKTTLLIFANANNPSESGRTSISPSSDRLDKNHIWERVPADSAFKLDDQFYLVSSVHSDGSTITIRKAKNAAIHGVVLDSKTGKGIAGALVSVYLGLPERKFGPSMKADPQVSANTNPDGRFHIEIPEGKCRLISITADGYVPRLDECNLVATAGIPLEVNENMTAANAPKSGKMVLNNRDSYHFLGQAMSQYPGNPTRSQNDFGDFIFQGGRFSAFFWYQGGVVDRGRIGDKPLDQVIPRATGYSSTVTAIVGHTYISPAKWGEEGHYIIFRVVGMDANNSVEIEYYYR